MKAEWLAAAFCLAAASAQAGEKPLDRAFLEYLEQFGDENGEVFDPSDLDATPPARNTSAARPEQGVRPDPRESHDHD